MLSFHILLGSSRKWIFQEDKYTDFDAGEKISTLN